MASTAFISSALTPANAQTAGQNQAYPLVTVPSTFLGGPSRRVLKTTHTLSGVQVMADRIIVKVQPGVADADMAQISKQAASLGAGAAKVVRSLPGYYLIDVTGAASVEVAAEAYRAADSRVLAASPDSVMKADAATNDPLFSSQMHLARIQAKEAWDRTRGTGIKIAILDTGIDESHPDIAGKVDARWNTVEDSSANTNDDIGHGTSVAGVAAAATNNMIGIAGVGPEARLLNVKIASDGIYPSFAAAAGIRWAADHGAHVINMSFGHIRDCGSSDADTVALRDALAYAWSKNVVLVGAAGNDGITAKTTPASCPNVLSVAGTANDDSVTSKSTRGAWVQVAAPGAGVIATRFPGERDPMEDDCPPFSDDDKYGSCGGTSFAAPIVSGIAALVRLSCGPSISNQTVFNRITSTVDVVPGTGTNWKYGRVNAKKAVCIPRPNLVSTGTNPWAISYSWDDRSFETYFEFSYRRFGTATWIVKPALPANTTQYLLGDLQLGEWYEARVRACDSLGCSEYSNSVVRQVDYYHLTVGRDGIGGSVFSLWQSGIDCGPISSSCQAVFRAGTQVTLRALGGTAWDGGEYQFHHWEGACSGSSIDCTVTINQMVDVTAVFFRIANGDPPSDL